MINVIASISVKTGSLSEYLAVLKANISAVRKEEGCIEYIPMVDIDAKLPPQVFNKNVVTIFEKWASLGTLHAHLGSPHMTDYRDMVKIMVESVAVKVLQEVD